MTRHQSGSRVVSHLWCSFAATSLSMTPQTGLRVGTTRRLWFGRHVCEVQTLAWKDIIKISCAWYTSHKLTKKNSKMFAYPLNQSIAIAWMIIYSKDVSCMFLVIVIEVIDLQTVQWWHQGKVMTNYNELINDSSGSDIVIVSCDIFSRNIGQHIMATRWQYMLTDNGRNSMNKEHDGWTTA